MKLIFEKTAPDRRCLVFPTTEVPHAQLPSPSELRTRQADLPEISELDLVRHFTRLSRRNYSLDSHFYPLGSCTMKYNPKIAEKVAALSGFTELHPHLINLPQGDKLVPGALRLLYELQGQLAELTGMDAVSLQPMAGAQGELAGVLMIKAYHEFHGNRQKKYILVPDASHGTNPASAAMAGYEVITIPTGKDGQMDIVEFSQQMNPEVAGVILTCPNTLGIFNTEISRICRQAHEHDALMYYDGANFNAILGRMKPGEVGFDIVHLNLHKTMGTPHGGGGPGAGPVCVREFLSRFLPGSMILYQPESGYCLSKEQENSIGSLAPFWGNFSVLVKAYAYLLLLGLDGLLEASEKAVLNANYIMSKLKSYYHFPYSRSCMHECVLSARDQKAQGASALDIAKYLIDAGIHPPTIYFPLIVEEAMMIEPTETECRETLDEFISCMIEAAQLAQKSPQTLKQSPRQTVVGRLDEVRAARELKLVYPSEQ